MGIESCLKIQDQQKIVFIRHFQTVSVILKKIYMGYLSPTPWLTKSVTPPKPYLIAQFVCLLAFHKEFIPPLEQFCTRDRTLQRSRVPWVYTVLCLSNKSSFATISSSYEYEHRSSHNAHHLSIFILFY